MTLAQQIRSAREKRGWTQEQLAVHADVSRSTIQNLETGRRQPHRASLRRIADALGVAVADLSPAQPMTLEEIAGKRAELLAALAELDAIERGDVG
jgi:transcriptional regulator with XRE-family HTH domain